MEHVLLRPDTYIGSTERQQQQLWVHDGERMVHKSIDFVPGLYKIFDEILVNAADNKVRDASMDTLRVDVDAVSWVLGRGGHGAVVRACAKPLLHTEKCSRLHPGTAFPRCSRVARHALACSPSDPHAPPSAPPHPLQDKGSIKVMNNGAGIPVEVHKTEGIYVPELIFGNLLTSSNYNDNEKKVGGGRTGAGQDRTEWGRGLPQVHRVRGAGVQVALRQACLRLWGRAERDLPLAAPACLPACPPYLPGLPLAGDGRAQRVRRQAGQHLLHQVCGGDVRRQARAALQADLHPEHVQERAARHHVRGRLLPVGVCVHV